VETKPRSSRYIQVIGWLLGLPSKKARYWTI